LAQPIAVHLRPADYQPSKSALFSQLDIAVMRPNCKPFID